MKKWTLILSACALLTSCAETPKINLPVAIEADSPIEDESDVLLQIWTENGKVRMDMEGNVSDIRDFDASVKKVFSGQSPEKFMEARFCLRVDQSVPVGDYFEAVYWLRRLKIAKHFLIVQTDVGVGAIASNWMPLQGAEDSILCQHYLGTYRPRLDKAGLGLLKPDYMEGTKDMIILEPPPMLGVDEFDLEKLLLEASNNIHLHFDSQGGCIRSGEKLTIDQVRELASSHSGNIRSKPNFVLVFADDVSMQLYVEVIDIFRAYNNRYNIVSSTQYRLFQPGHHN